MLTSTWLGGAAPELSPRTSGDADGATDGAAGLALGS
jgi:hypothetical protein